METLSIIQAAEKHLSTRREQLEKDLEDLKNNERRVKVLAAFLDNNLPAKIKSRSEITFSGYGSYVYATVAPKRYDSVSKKNYGFTDDDTKLITAFCGEAEKWDFKKEVSNHSGVWFHKLSRWTGGFESHYEITFDTISNIDGCELVETEETRVVKTYKVKC